MIVFRSTLKVRALLGISDDDLIDVTGDEIGEWFVDMAVMDRRKCLLFTHKLTLYSFWVLGIRKTDRLRFNELFRDRLTATLSADGFQEDEIRRLLRVDGYRFGKTNSRIVTGSMNDHIRSSRWYVQQDGGIASADIVAINRRLNRTPMGALAPGSDMDHPIRVLERILRPIDTT